VGSRQLITTYPSSLNQAKYLEDTYGGVSVAVTLYIRTRKLFVSKLVRDTEYYHFDFSWFSFVFPENTKTISFLYHNSFLPNPLQFIVQPTTQFHSLAADRVMREFNRYGCQVMRVMLVRKQQIY
jgi:uncharacterized protein YkuJ